MRKFFILLTFAISTQIGFSADTKPSSADLQAEIVQLKEKINSLEVQLQSANAKYVKQIKDDMAILSKLREENRALKSQLRKLQRSMGKTSAPQAQAKSAPKSEDKSQASSPARVEISAESAAKAAEEAEASVPQKVEQHKPESQASGTPAKNDSIWDHMFPF